MFYAFLSIFQFKFDLYDVVLQLVDPSGKTSENCLTLTLNMYNLSVDEEVTALPVAQLFSYRRKQTFHLLAATGQLHKDHRAVTRGNVT